MSYPPDLPLLSIRQLVAGVLDAWNAHDSALAARYYAPGYDGVNVGEAGPHHGQESIRRGLAVYFAAIPDLRFTCDDLLIEGERAVVVWTAHGTHQGPLMRIPPTGHAIQVRGVSIFTARDGRIMRGLHVWDVAGLLRNLRLLPDLRPAPSEEAN